MREAIYQIPLISDFNIRKELLLFDKVYIPKTLIEQKKSAYENNAFHDRIDEMYADLDYLVDQNQVVIIDLEKSVKENIAFLTNESNLENIISDYSDLEKEMLQKRISYLFKKIKFTESFLSLRPKLRFEINKAVPTKRVAEKLLTYMSLREKYDSSCIEIASLFIDTCTPTKIMTPVLSSENYFFEANKKGLRLFESLEEHEINSITSTNKKTDVTSIILGKIAVPSKDNSLQDILEFKADQNNIRKLRDLNRWFSKLNSNNISRREIEEEIDYLLSEYERILKINKLKFNYTKTEVILNMTLGTLEKLLTLKWSKLGQGVIDFKKAKADFELAESQTKGRELAYLYEVKNRLK
ncbi:hypothetical protein [Winogradskyella sp.]|uniref:hypothetical protein n=1 Tax=Winogradskyella sp. TaxID=1883156 RepID=UPI0026185DD3|nr:hypothetical protein [Winogradskyella sp.]